jgi:HD-like signal output (HDOD) protein
MNNQKQEFERKVCELVSRFPPMPNNIDGLLKAAENGHANQSDVMKMIKSDSGLCANLLHLANAFRSNYETPINSIEDAVKAVGILPLVELIRIWYANNSINQQVHNFKHINDYSAHSQSISFGCKTLAELLNLKENDIQMLTTAGLIHDIGRLVMIIAGDRGFINLIGTTVDKLDTILQNEKEVLGMNHCEVGMFVCRKWNFSDVLHQGILRHHTPLVGDDFNFVGSVIFIAHFLTESDLTGETLIKLLPKELLQKTGLTVEEFEIGREICKKTKLEQ